MHRVSARVVFARVGFTIDETVTARRALIDALLAEDGPLRTLSPSATHVGLMCWDTKWHRTRLTNSEASEARLHRAIGLNDLTLRAWAGAGKSFNEVSDDDHWLNVTFRGDGKAEIRLSEPEHRAELLAGLLRWVTDRHPVAVGGAWGGEPPPWVDAPNRWWFRFFEPPLVPGPLWLLVAPPATDRVLAADTQATTLAVDIERLRFGSVWRLVDQPAALTADAVRAWSDMMDRLGLLPADPPVRQLVADYLNHSHQALPTRWP